MTAVETRLVALPCDDGVLELIGDIDSAAARAAKADPADRLDIVRFESLSVQLERQAAQAWRDGAASVTLPAAAPGELPAVLPPGGEPATPAAIPSGPRADVDAWRRQGCAVVGLCLPFAAAEQAIEERPEPTPPPPPVERWESEVGAQGRAAVEERFRSQLEAAVAAGEGERKAISPSGLQNTVVTEVLREFVAAADGGSRVDVAVEYRDGSPAQNAFPLRALALAEELVDAPELSLRMALLSIRHTEMDAVVDGAWLRNAEISRKRPAAQTDDLVFEISRNQLAELTQQGRRSLRLQMFQTGLETAIVGFYRAVALHLLEHPGSLWVVPMYHQAPPRPKKSRSGRRKKTVVQARAPFRPGTGWAA